MSTSRDSRIGLPLSRLSSTANSRARSCSTRAIRYRYLARSRPGIGPQVDSYARRAAATAASTSAAPASATRASGSSVAGLIVAKVVPSAAGRNSPSTNSPYSASTLTTSRDSGAGAYSHAARSSGLAGWVLDLTSAIYTCTAVGWCRSCCRLADDTTAPVGSDPGGRHSHRTLGLYGVKCKLDWRRSVVLVHPWPDHHWPATSR